VYCENFGSCSMASSEVPLPIWTVDEDIYSRLPSLVIGTVDKFAQIVRKPETGRLFGLGTTNYPPELILQDELHLITGPLGTIAGLYETAIDELCFAAGGRPKIIGSTATIRRASDQVKALFNRSVYQYPAPGLTADNSCFSVRDDTKPGRVYLGITSAGRSPKFALQAVSASVLQSSNDPSIAEENTDDYWTLLTYFNSLRELGGAHVLMLDDVPKSINEYARRRNEEPRKLGEPVELSSNLSQSEIPQALRALGIKRGSNGAIDVALATTMVSVGMDIPRLALMIVNGQPKTIAEYIQATSRVGRDAVSGLVITAFNVNKARDRSHYETFCSWHGTLYRDVEATSVTPFAPRAQDKALHAVLVALVRHTVQGMASNPFLSPQQRRSCASIEKALADRAREVDKVDGLSVPRKLSALLDHWEQRGELARYWNDRSYNQRPPLMMSAENYAALKAVGNERADIWPTMNSMREVEPSCNFKLVERLRVVESVGNESVSMDDEE
jgi:superfamily II DNA or RNA helicase